MIVAAMFVARDAVIRSLANPQARSQWEEFREAARESSDDEGPVKRRVPPSADPPALVLMNTPWNFAVCLVAACFFGSMLFAVTMIVVRGVSSSKSGPIDGSRKEDPPR